MKLQEFIEHNCWLAPFKLKQLIKAKFKTTLSEKVFNNRLKRARNGD